MKVRWCFEQRFLISGVLICYFYFLVTSDCTCSFQMAAIWKLPNCEENSPWPTKNWLLVWEHCKDLLSEVTLIFILFSAGCYRDKGSCSLRKLLQVLGRYCIMPTFVTSLGYLKSPHVTTHFKGTYATALFYYSIDVCFSPLLFCTFLHRDIHSCCIYFVILSPRELVRFLPIH